MAAAPRYKVAQNPSDRLWYVIGLAGKHWMPVSDGYRARSEASSRLPKIKMAEDAAKAEVRV